MSISVPGAPALSLATRSQDRALKPGAEIAAPDCVAVALLATCQPPAPRLMTSLAQVTMSKLITDYNALAPMLRDLGFDAIAFSYPQSARLGSSSMAWSDTSDLVRFTPAELIKAFDAVDELRRAGGDAARYRSKGTRE